MMITLILINNDDKGPYIYIYICIYIYTYIYISVTGLASE